MTDGYADGFPPYARALVMRRCSSLRCIATGFCAALARNVNIPRCDCASLMKIAHPS